MKAPVGRNRSVYGSFIFEMDCFQQAGSLLFLWLWICRAATTPIFFRFTLGGTKIPPPIAQATGFRYSPIRLAGGGPRFPKVRIVTSLPSLQQGHLRCGRGGIAAGGLSRGGVAAGGLP